MKLIPVPFPPYALRPDQFPPLHVMLLAIGVIVAVIIVLEWLTS